MGHRPRLPRLDHRPGGRGSGPRPPEPAHLRFRARLRFGAGRSLEASLTLGSREDLAATPDEIDPNPAVKQGRSAFPAIDRSGKGDPFIIFRPSFQAKRAPQPAPREADSAEDWPDNSRSPARVADVDPSAPSALLPFGDGTTPEAPLDFALNSSTPTSSDGKLLIAEQKPAPQKAARRASDARRPRRPPRRRR